MLAAPSLIACACILVAGTVIFHVLAKYRGWMHWCVEVKGMVLFTNFWCPNEVWHYSFFFVIDEDLIYRAIPAL